MRSARCSGQPSADERARQLEIGARVDEHPGVLVTEAEEAKLLEAPSHHALILERELEGGWWVLCRRHTSSNDGYPRELLTERKA